MSGVFKALFGGGGSRYVPPVAPTTPATPTPVTQADTSIAESGMSQRQGAAAGLASTIKTSTAGTQGQAQVGLKSLLGG